MRIVYSIHQNLMENWMKISIKKMMRDDNAAAVPSNTFAAAAAADQNTAEGKMRTVVVVWVIEKIAQLVPSSAM